MVFDPCSARLTRASKATAWAHAAGAHDHELGIGLGHPHQVYSVFMYSIKASLSRAGSAVPQRCPWLLLPGCAMS